MDNDKTDSQDILSENYPSDPIAANAARYATEATEPPKPRHPLANTILTVLATLILLLGMASVILGTINSVQNAHQADEQKRQQQCNTQLIKAIAEEQVARSKIAADDRNTIEQLVRSVAQATTSEEVQKALSTFQHRSHINNIRRSKVPIPDVNSIDVCKSTLKSSPLPNSTTSHAASSSASPSGQPITGSSSADSAGQPPVVRTTAPNGHVTTVPVRNPPTPTATSTRIVKVPQPRPTKTVTSTKPAPRPTSPTHTHSPQPPVKIPLPSLSVCVPGISCVGG